MIAYVNSSAATVAGPATSIASPATSLTAGNLLVVGLRVGTTALSITGMTDTAGNVYRPTGAAQATAASGVVLWYAFNCAGNGANVVTATFNSCSHISITTVQVSGLSTNFPQDTWSVSASLVSATPTVTAFSTLTADEILLIYGDNDASGSAWSASAGYTLATQDTSNYQGVAYQIVSSLQSGITPSITSADGTNHKVAVAITFRVAVTYPPYALGTIVVADANTNNGLNGVLLNAATAATLAQRIPLGAYGGNGAGEGGAQLQNGDFLVPSKGLSATVASIQIYDKTFAQLSNTQPFTALHWDVFSPMASDFSGLFWVSKVDTTPNATQVRSVTPGGTLGSVLTLDDAAGPVVQSMGVSQDNSTLYYTTRTNGSAVKKWDTATNTSAGTLVAAGGTKYFAQDLIVIPGTPTFVAIVEPAGSGSTTWELHRYSTVNGALLAAFALPGNIGNFNGPEMSLDLNTPQNDVWIRSYVDGTGATVTFLEVSLLTGAVITSLTVAQSLGGVGGGNPGQVPFTCPFFVNGGTPPPPPPGFVGGAATIPTVRKRRVPLAVLSGDRYQFPGQFVVQVEKGQGILGDPTDPAHLQMKLSVDNGETWGTERSLSVGATGDFDGRVTANSWPRARYPVLEVTVSDNANVTITDLLAKIEEGTEG